VAPGACLRRAAYAAPSSGVVPLQNSALGARLGAPTSAPEGGSRAG